MQHSLWATATGDSMIPSTAKAGEIQCRLQKDRLHSQSSDRGLLSWPSTSSRGGTPQHLHTTARLKRIILPKCICCISHSSCRLSGRNKIIERRKKGAVLSTFVSLADNHIVYMPNRGHCRKISRRIRGSEREKAIQFLDEFGDKLTGEEGIIVRTASASCYNGSDLEKVLTRLRSLWGAVTEAEQDCVAPALLFEDADISIQTIRDYGNSSVDSVVLDEEGHFKKVKKFVDAFFPNLSQRIEQYQKKSPLFAYFGIERQIQALFNREVKLPSGGEIVIDRTEALTSVDVNSARSTRGINIDETALNTNLEATKAIAQQIQLRDIGGLLVIDFIDMAGAQDKLKVEQSMQEALKNDKARTQITDISPLGLMEMSRQWLQHSSHNLLAVKPCQVCGGKGEVPTDVTSAMSVLYALQEKALSNREMNFLVYVPLDVGNYLLNIKKADLSSLEEETGGRINVFISESLQAPAYHIRMKPLDAALPVKLPDFSRENSTVLIGQTSEDNEFSKKGTSFKDATATVSRIELEKNKTASSSLLFRCLLAPFSWPFRFTKKLFTPAIQSGGIKSSRGNHSFQRGSPKHTQGRRRYPSRR